MGLDYVEGITYDRVIYPTTTLFPALAMVADKVYICCKRRHRQQEYLQFL